MKIFIESFVGIEVKKRSLKLDRPICFPTLNHSKILMYDCHNKYFKKSYAKLLFTDTDILCYNIKTDDIFQDMYQYKETFDFLCYPTNSHNPTNKKIIGKMKGEKTSKIITEFVSLHAKMSTFVVRNYVNTLLEKTQSVVQMKVIRSTSDHVLINQQNPVELL